MIEIGLDMVRGHAEPPQGLQDLAAPLVITDTAHHHALALSHGGQHLVRMHGHVERRAAECFVLLRDVEQSFAQANYRPLHNHARVLPGRS